MVESRPPVTATSFVEPSSSIIAGAWDIGDGQLEVDFSVLLDHLPDPDDLGAGLQVLIEGTWTTFDYVSYFRTGSVEGLSMIVGQFEDLRPLVGLQWQLTPPVTGYTYPGGVVGPQGGTVVAYPAAKAAKIAGVKLLTDGLKRR